MQDFNKSAKTEQELLDLLISRGLSVSDKEKAICYLKKVGYYRLSAYWYSFREKAPNNSKKRLDKFVPGASFDDAVLLYNFDTRLRALVFEAIGVFEIRLKSALVQYLTLRYENDPFVHERGDVAFNRNFNHAKWLEHIHDSTQHAVNSNEFLRHYKSTYSGFPKIPVWMVMEILSLGEVSKQQTPMMIELAEPIQKTMIFTFDRFTGNLKSTGAFENEYTSGENVVTMENIPLNPTKQIFSFSENKSTSILFFPKGFPKTIQIFFQALHNQKFEALLHDKTAFLEISQAYLLHTSAERYIRLMSKMDHRKTVTCVENNSSGKMNCRPFGL